MFLCVRVSVSYLSQIPPSARRRESELRRDFETATPGMIAGLLDAVSCAIANQGEIVFHELPRMADFAAWATAAAPALGLQEGTFMASYAINRRAVHALPLEVSLVVEPLLTMLDEGGFEGTSTELLAKLNSRVSEAIQKGRGWPKQANVLSNALRRLAPNLRAIGIEVVFFQTGGKGSRRLVKIEKLGEPTDATDATDASKYENVAPGTVAPSTPPPPGTDAGQIWSVDGVNGVDESDSYSIDDLEGPLTSGNHWKVHPAHAVRAPS